METYAPKPGLVPLNLQTQHTSSSSSQKNSSIDSPNQAQLPQNPTGRVISQNASENDMHVDPVNPTPAGSSNIDTNQPPPIVEVEITPIPVLPNLGVV